MSIREDIEELERKVEEVEKESLAMEMIKDCKKQRNILLTIWIITFIALLAVTSYLIYVLNDIGTSEETIDIQDVNTIDNSKIKIGDDYGESQSN
jgi:hypothetical protein